MLDAKKAQSTVALPDREWRAAAALNLASAWLTPAEAQGQRTLREPGVWASDPGSAFPLANSATLLRPFAAEEAPSLIARLARFYAAGRGAPWALWSAWPIPDLRPLGGSFAGRPPLMARPAGASPAAPPELDIREVADQRGITDFERVFVDGYPISELQPFRPGALFTPAVLGGDYHLWVGYVADHPVTCAVAHVAANVVGIHFVATLPEARRRGYGAAITARAANTAPDLPAVLQASDLGRPVYERIGFHVVSRFDLWILPRLA